MVNHNQKTKNSQRLEHPNYRFHSKLLFLVSGVIIILSLYGFQIHTVQMESEITSIENINQEKPIFRYVSSNNDLENETEILKTTYETTYHTFNFNENTIVLKAPNGNGDWKTFKYKFRNYRSLPNEVMEFDVDHPGCYQVWVDAAGNIGYELKNGQTLVFYDIKTKPN